MSFNISAKVYAINNAFFFTKILHIEKPGGTGGDGSGNSHDLKIFEKTGGDRGEPGGGDRTIRNISTILQKAPVSHDIVRDTPPFMSFDQMDFIINVFCVFFQLLCIKR